MHEEQICNKENSKTL